jgi:hypothetical protein
MLPGVTTKATDAYTRDVKGLTKSTRHFESGEAVKVDNDQVYSVSGDESAPDYHLLGFQVDNKKAYLPEDAYKHTSASFAGMMDMLHKVWKRKNEILAVQQPIYNMYNDVYSSKTPATISSADYMEQIAKTIEGRAKDAITQSQESGPVSADSMRQAGSAAWDSDFIHFRRKKSEQTGETVERVYLNVATDHVPTVMDYIVKTMVDDPKHFPGVNNAKLGGRKDVVDRTDTIVIYTTGGDGTKQVVEEMRKYIKQHDDYFENETPLMTEEMAKGMGTGAEPAVGYRDAQPHYPNVDVGEFKNIYNEAIQGVTSVWAQLDPGEQDYFSELHNQISNGLASGRITVSMGTALVDFARGLRSLFAQHQPFQQNKAKAKQLVRGATVAQDPGEIKGPQEALASFGGLRASLIYDALYAEHADFNKFLEKVKEKFTAGKVSFDKPSENLP